MSQVDKLVYIPLLFWFVAFFFLLYFFLFSYFLPLFFSTFKVRSLFFYHLLALNRQAYLVRYLFSFFLGSAGRGVIYNYWEAGLGFFSAIFMLEKAMTI